ncbi:hypothetical protein OS242_07180 [Tumebacillus sp. DT12]|uniref:Uncharacterized protein n=1 Tax=Tumebacillus lacus TaxID=2995335 RepID=A0ABT3WYJ8_9BACL|nr:hypothetical protein [Tumebacillus lacus]MCX7569743.1 hypothetical protein [Tumebacillus lacus]
MAKQRKMVDFGYGEQVFDAAKGTLLVLDSFDAFTEHDLRQILELAERRRFSRIVLFPHNEKTLATLGVRDASPFHRRVKEIESLLDDVRTDAYIRIDTFEEKRKKYTPMELILRHIGERHPGPYFLYLSAGYANAFAGFASFPELIRGVRLIIHGSGGYARHPMLEKFEKRCDFIES